MTDNIGSKILTADGSVGTAGKPYRLFSATCLSDGTARTLVLRNGTVDTDTVWVTGAGIIAQTVTLNFEGGLLFDKGCFFDIGSAVSCVFAGRVEA